MEFGLLNDRIAVDVTYWDRVTTDALVARQFPVTGGFTATQLDNIGQMDATGVEATVNGSVYNSENLSVNVFANTAYIDEVVTDLGGAPPLKTGGSYPRYRNYLRGCEMVNGVERCYAPGSFFGAVLDPNMAIPLNLNGDCSEPSRAEALEFFSEARNPSSFDVIPVGCAGGASEYLSTYIGKPTPDFAGSAGFNMNFLGSFDLSTNFEYRAGNYHTQDLTGAFRQANAVIGRNVPGTARVASIMQNPASTAEQRLEAALEWAREYRALAPMSGMNQIWSSDFIRLREISLSYRLPTDMIEGFGLDNATVTFGGPQREALDAGGLPGNRPRDQPAVQLHRRWRQLQLPHGNGSLWRADPTTVHLLAARGLLGRKMRMNKNHRSFLAALGAMAFLGGCDILEVDNPNALVQADIEKVEAAAAAVNGAQALAARGIGGIYAAFSTVGDEITWIGSRDAWNELNQGTPNNSGNEFADGSFPGIAQARWMTNFAVGLLEGHVGEDAGNATLQSDLARANLYAGVVYSAIAQMFDDFAFSNRTEPGPLIGEANMHSVFDQAIAFYSAAMQGGGETALRAQAGRAQAYHQKAIWGLLNPPGSTPSNPLINDSNANSDAMAVLSSVAGTDWAYRFAYSGATYSNNLSWQVEREG